MNIYKTTSIVIGLFLFLLPFIFDITPTAVSIICIAAGIRTLASVWLRKRDALFYMVNGVCLAAMVVAVILLIIQR